MQMYAVTTSRNRPLNWHKSHRFILSRKTEKKPHANKITIYVQRPRFSDTGHAFESRCRHGRNVVVEVIDYVIHVGGKVCRVSGRWSALKEEVSNWGRRAGRWGSRLHPSRSTSA